VSDKPFISITIEAEGAIADLRAASRSSTRYAQKGLRKGIKDIAVPRARATVAHKKGTLAGSIKSSVRGLTGYVVSSLPYAGLIEFGGVRKDAIQPNSKRAVTPAFGVAVAQVTTPRSYRGEHRMQAAATASAAAIADITEQAVLEAFAIYFPVV
jgi:hypothetical protein